MKDMQTIEEIEASLRLGMRLRCGARFTATRDPLFRVSAQLWSQWMHHTIRPNYYEPIRCTMRLDDVIDLCLRWPFAFHAYNTTPDETVVISLDDALNQHVKAALNLGDPCPNPKE